MEKNLEKIRNQSWLEQFLKGAPLLTYLYKILMCCEADLQAVDLLRMIFKKSVQPLLQMISEFIYTGSFNDPCGEFFVERAGEYKLTSDPIKIPSFVGGSMALAIFKIG